MKLELASDLIGVIDLKNGKAVHAIAGQRDDYQPIRYAAARVVDGNPIRLAEFYLGLGLTRLYIADLNGILDQTPQIDLIKTIIDQLTTDSTEVFLDVGVHTRFDFSLAHDFVDRWPKVKFIVATECAESVECLTTLAETIPPKNVFLGMDYRIGEFVSGSTSEDQWMAVAANSQIGGVVALDVASVGKGSIMSTMRLCERLLAFSRQHTMHLISGGGVQRASDVLTLKSAGCQGVLVASSLLKLGARFFDSDQSGGINKL